MFSTTPASSANLSPASAHRQFSASPPPLEVYTLSSNYTHLVEEPGMDRVIAQKIALIQNTLPNLSADNLRQARADMMFLRTILEGEGGQVAQVRAGAVYSAPV
ncbi:hypothetical protein I316_07641 [Kwoniella heveanensis BCC8398]|uniref:Uncharacterized protein n=1 Tax=Kwoniella heveanensis BCC8398 TaxID=1296120 RepID=A0A1B9GI72_9TREE|nr:hypothetical protein I316_07641 [Kwoniella heveanensis BCC8398]